MLLTDTWKILFEKGLSLLKFVGIPPNKWSFGGGTALYVCWNCPRISKDVDFFLTDAQWLTYLTPRLNDLADSICEGNYVEQSNFVKLTLGDGNIDFIIAPRLTDEPVAERIIEPFGTVPVDTPWEIIAKKFFYRSNYFTVRDVVDFLSVVELYQSMIPENFWLLLGSRAEEIQERWEDIKLSVEEALTKLSVAHEKPSLIKLINSPKEVCRAFDKLLEKYANCPLLQRR